jgi:hypothetical protein
MEIGTELINIPVGQMGGNDIRRFHDVGIVKSIG